MQPLFTGAEWEHRDRVLDEVEKNSCIVLSDKGGTQWANTHFDPMSCSGGDCGESDSV